MKQLAPDVHVIYGFPPYAINAYLVGDVLIDACSRHDAKRILREISGRGVSAHALTHAHADHQGASHEVCETLGIPFWVGELDVEAAEGGGAAIRERMPSHPMPKFMVWALSGPGHPVDRKLHEGDQVGGFEVLEVPGHSAGHVAFWRESDRVLICGDVFNNMHVLTGIPGLHEPPGFFTPDPARNRDSMRRLAELEPELVCFGHGRPLRDPRKFREFTERVTSS